jgi:hypothetical protein
MIILKWMWYKGCGLVSSASAQGEPMAGLAITTMNLRVPFKRGIFFDS